MPITELDITKVFHSFCPEPFAQGMKRLCIMTVWPCPVKLCCGVVFSSKYPRGTHISQFIEVTGSGLSMHYHSDSP
jgi:hypothetical protein